MNSTTEARGVLFASMKLLTQQRLAFDQKMCEKAPARFHKGATAAGVHQEQQADISSDDLLQTGVLSIEGRVTYMKLQGDQLLHLAEMTRYNDELPSPECDRLAAEALEAYLAAQREASSKGAHSTTTSSSREGGSLPELHPLRLELALRISSVLLHMLGRPVEAWEAAYGIYLVAAERPARLGPRGLAIAQLLRDHLAFIDVRCSGRESEENNHILAENGACRLREGVDAWSFRRLSQSLDRGVLPGVADKNANLRALAQVKQARVCMDGVAKVLLGTMEKAGIVQSALKQIFTAYVKQHALPAQPCHDGSDKHVWLQGRRVTLQHFLRHGPFLSWSGFEAICDDFKIAAAVAAAAAPSHHHHNHVAVASNVPRSRSDQQTRDIPPKIRVENAECVVTEGFLLNTVQARIAFTSACTHGSVVASFPEGGGSRSAVRDNNSGPSGERITREEEEEEAYWQEMERAIASGSPPEATGLTFRQFVDALARCGLIGFSPCGIGTGPPAAVGTGTGAGQGANRAKGKSPTTPAERTQSVLTVQMRLLDSPYVDAKIQAKEEAITAAAQPEQHGSGRGAATTGLGPPAASSASGRTKGGLSSGHNLTKKSGEQVRGRVADAGLRGGGTARAGAAASAVVPAAKEDKAPTLTPIADRGSARTRRVIGAGSTPMRGGVRRADIATR